MENKNFLDMLYLSDFFRFFLYRVVHWEKIPIKITVLAQYSCSICIFLYKILYTEGYRKQVFRVLACISVCVWKCYKNTGLAR